MGYKIRIDFGKAKRKKQKSGIWYYGTGQFGKGRPYKTRRNAEKEAEFLSKVLHKKTVVVEVKD